MLMKRKPTVQLKRAVAKKIQNAPKKSWGCEKSQKKNKEKDLQ